MKKIVKILVVFSVFIWIAVLPITAEYRKLLILLLFAIPFIKFCLFDPIKKLLHDRKAKKLKYERTWILKKTKIFNIGKRHVSTQDDSYDLYRLESKDEAWNIYRSDDFLDYREGRTLNDMIKEHNWIIYDLRNKDAATQQITNRIKELDMEFNDAWFFKQVKLRWDISWLEQFLAIAKEGPVKPCIVCYGKRVYVWDSIDVYVSPEDPKLYYFDLDFTKEN